MIGDASAKLRFYIGGALLLALVAALFIVSISKNATIAALEKSIDAPVTGYAARLDAAERDRDQCRANRAVLGAAVDRQNAAIEAAGRETAARADRLADVAAQAKASANAAADRAADLLARERSGEACGAADALILETPQ